MQITLDTEKLAQQIAECLMVERPQKRLLKATDAAEYLSISRPTLAELTQRGKLTKVYVDSDARYDVRELDRLVDSIKRGDIL